MTENKPLALHLADCLDYDEFDVVEDSQRTAAELRRQHEEITQLRHGAGVANLTIATLVAAHDEDQHAIAVWRDCTQRVEAQRDQLLEALTAVISADGCVQGAVLRAIRNASTIVESVKESL